MECITEIVNYSFSIQCKIAFFAHSNIKGTTILFFLLTRKSFKHEWCDHSEQNFFYKGNNLIMHTEIQAGFDMKWKEDR